MSDSLWPHGHQASLSITNSRSLLKLMSIESVMPSNHLALCLQSFSLLLLLPSIFPNIRVFSSELILRVRWPSIGLSASASVLPMNIQDWFTLGFTGLILQSKGLSRVFFNTTVQKINSLALSFLYSTTLTSIHDHWKNIYFCFIDYTKAFDCVHHNKLWKILKVMGIPDHPTCLLRNLYAGQEATVRTRCGTDWFQIGKGVCQGCILSPCLFNLYAEYIMRNARMDEAQAGIKIAGRNINNLSYTDDTTLMAESEELKCLLMKMKEESEKVGLELNIQKTKIMASSSITSWQIDVEAITTVRDFIFWGLPNHCRWWLQPWN